MIFKTKTKKKLFLLMKEYYKFTRYKLQEKFIVFILKALKYNFFKEILQQSVQIYTLCIKRFAITSNH